MKRFPALLLTLIATPIYAIAGSIDDQAEITAVRFYTTLSIVAEACHIRPLEWEAGVMSRVISSIPPSRKDLQMEIFFSAQAETRDIDFYEKEACLDEKREPHVQLGDQLIAGKRTIWDVLN